MISYQHIHLTRLSAWRLQSLEKLANHYVVWNNVAWIKCHEFFHRWHKNGTPSQHVVPSLYFLCHPQVVGHASRLYAQVKLLEHWTNALTVFCLMVGKNNFPQNLLQRQLFQLGSLLCMFWIAEPTMFVKRYAQHTSTKMPAYKNPSP